MSGIKLSKNPVPDPANPEVGKPFKLVAEVTRDPVGGLSVWWTKDDISIDATRQHGDTSSGPIEVALEIATFADTDFGIYKVAAAESIGSLSSVDLGHDAEIQVVRLQSDATPAAEASKEELRDLVWDPNFAATTGAFVGIGLLGFAIFCSIGFARSIEGAVDKTGFTSVVLFTGIFLGSAAVIVSGWLIVLEMRGRALNVADKGIVQDLAEGAAKILSTIGRMTGPVALLSVGLLIFAGTLWLANTSDDAIRKQLAIPTTTTEP